METEDVGDQKPEKRIYDEVPLKGDGVSTVDGNTQSNRMPRYQETLDELQKALKILDSERCQMNQREEKWAVGLADQHSKIDYGLQLIIDEISALKTQSSQESDLNVLMVQFVVVAIRLLVEAALNGQKVESLIPALEAELEKLQLPSRHPRLLACFNRLRTLCGKDPVSQGELAAACTNIVVSTGDRNGYTCAATLNQAGADGLDTSTAAQRRLRPQKLNTQTSLVDESGEERNCSGSSEEFSVLVVGGGPEGGTPFSNLNTGASASFDLLSRQESLFSAGERRRTATAVGDGDLPLFQQFAFAATAPAPDSIIGFRAPLDTAVLSKSPKSALRNEPAEALLPPLISLGNQTSNASEDRYSNRSSADAGETVDCSTSQGDCSNTALLEWRNSAKKIEYPRKHVSGQPEHQTATGVYHGGLANSEPADASMNLQGSSTSADYILKHAPTSISLTPTEVWTALNKGCVENTNENALKISTNGYSSVISTGNAGDVASDCNCSGADVRPPPAVRSTTPSQQFHGSAVNETAGDFGDQANTPKVIDTSPAHPVVQAVSGTTRISNVSREGFREPENAKRPDEIALPQEQTADRRYSTSEIRPYAAVKELDTVWPSESKTNPPDSGESGSLMPPMGHIAPPPTPDASSPMFDHMGIGYVKGMHMPLPAGFAAGGPFFPSSRSLYQPGHSSTTTGEFPRGKHAFMSGGENAPNRGVAWEVPTHGGPCFVYAPSPYISPWTTPSGAFTQQEDPDMRPAEEIPFFQRLDAAGMMGNTNFVVGGPFVQLPEVGYVHPRIRVNKWGASNHNNDFRGIPVAVAVAHRQTPFDTPRDDGSWGCCRNFPGASKSNNTHRASNL